MKQQEIAQLHTEWLQHPVTQEVLKIIDRHENRITESLTGNAMSEDNNNLIRGLGVQIKTIRAIKLLIFNTEKFVEKIEEAQPKKILVINNPQP